VRGTGEEGKYTLPENRKWQEVDVHTVLYTDLWTTWTEIFLEVGKFGDSVSDIPFRDIRQVKGRTRVGTTGFLRRNTN
jgi:hypothetical protein